MYLDETRLSQYPLVQGSPIRRDVIKVQDLLRLNGYDVGASRSDGDFGNATLKAVRAYQERQGFVVTGQVDEVTYTSLAKPLIFALNFKPVAKTFPEAVLEVANAHLRMHPTELDENRGNWVRSYCQGLDGKDFAWCQGFVSTLWQQAAQALNMASPIDLLIYDQALGRKIWCLFVPTMADQSRKQAKFLTSSQVLGNATILVPGSMFYVKNTGRWPYSHVGIVSGPAKLNDKGIMVFPTIEGNTNANGSANGFEVCARERVVSTCDYGLAA